MIFILTGGIGSGKTLSAIKNIHEHPEQTAFINFTCKLKNTHRLRYSDIVMTQIVKDGNKDKKIQSVNWDFWKKQQHKPFSIYLDEVHNIISSRRSISKSNILMSEWVSQIRKILGDNKDCHLFLMTQTMRKIDINFRDLAHALIVCAKFKAKGCLWIRQDFYGSEDDYLRGHRFLRKIFNANRYFKMYNTKEMVSFSDAGDDLL